MNGAETSEPIDPQLSEAVLLIDAPSYEDPNQITSRDEIKRGEWVEIVSSSGEVVEKLLINTRPYEGIKEGRVVVGVLDERGHEGTRNLSDMGVLPFVLENGRVVWNGWQYTRKV